MAQKPGFFSRLFKRLRPKDEDGAKTKVNGKMGTASEDDLSRKSDIQEAAREEKPELDGELVLPVMHSLNSLWALYTSATSHRTAQPHLSLKAAMEPIQSDVEGADPVYLLSAKELPGELVRLERTVTTAADRRLVRQKTVDDNPSPDLDAEVILYLGPRALTAWVFILPPSGAGAHLNADILKLAIDGAKITTGLDNSLLQELPERPDRYFQLFLIARGEPPVDGKDGYTVDRFSRKPTRALHEDEQGCVDFAASDLFQSASAGDVICDIYAATPCKNGINVQGAAIAARPGKNPVVPKGRNTELNENGTALVASRDGHVEFSGRGFQIRTVLEISSNIDYSTGNVKSLGDIHIRGDVLSGFSVTSAGNITIDGVVETCNIEAGGDLVVRGGVQGGGTGVLRAHGNIFARFLESTNVYVGRDLSAECVINCNVYCDGVVKVRSGRGSIIGGLIHAAQEISATSVGARSEPLTAVVLGGTPCENFERDSLQQEIANLEKEMERLSRQPDSPTKSRLLAKAKVQIMANQRRLEAFNSEEAPAESVPSKGRVVTTRLFPGVEVTIDKVRTRVTHEHGMCTVSLFDGMIQII